MNSRRNITSGIRCTWHVGDSSPDACPTSDKETLRDVIPDAMTNVGIRDIGRGILDALLVMCREFFSWRVSYDVCFDAVNDVEIAFSDIFLASSDVVVRRESPPVSCSVRRKNLKCKFMTQWVMLSKTFWDQYNS